MDWRALYDATYVMYDFSFVDGCGLLLGHQRDNWVQWLDRGMAG